MPVNYENAYIYELSNTVNDKVYVGCSTNKITVCLSMHVTAAREGSNLNSLYISMREIGSMKFSIRKLEDYATTSKKLLNERRDIVAATYPCERLIMNTRNPKKRGKDVATIVREESLKVTTSPSSSSEDDATTTPPTTPDITSDSYIRKLNGMTDLELIVFLKKYNATATIIVDGIAIDVSL